MASRLSLPASLRRAMLTAATAAGVGLALTASPAARAQSQGTAPYQDYPRTGSPQAASPEQQLQRCNTGRLLGGLVGGGIGYAASRQDGRYWAVPLGGLLGAQAGCNAAIGNGPRPW